MSKLVCSVESWTTAQPDVEKLIAEHWEEIALHKDRQPLDPNWSTYRTLADTGMLVAVTARDEGLLVGYALFFVLQHMHYNSTVWAMNDVLFLKKSHRKGVAGFKLIRAADKAMQERGVSRITWHVKVHHDFGMLLKRLGYEVEEMVWGKFVGA